MFCRCNIRFLLMHLTAVQYCSACTMNLQDKAINIMNSKSLRTFFVCGAIFLVLNSFQVEISKCISVWLSLITLIKLMRLLKTTCFIQSPVTTSGFGKLVDETKLSNNSSMCQQRSELSHGVNFFVCFSRGCLFVQTNQISCCSQANR